MREYKTFSFKAGNTDGLDPDCFQGYAAAFGNVDSYGDIIERGAFAKAIADFLEDGAVCWQHDWTEPIGKPLDMYEDQTGLFIKARISQTVQGKDALILLRDGVVTKMSIGYQTLGYRIVSDDEGRELLGDSAYDEALRSLPWYMDGVRVLTQIKLFEVSLVTVPANDDATVTGVKDQGSLAGLTLGDHFQAVLAAEREYITRVKALAEIRARDGRALSENHRDRIEEMLAGVKSHALALEGLLEQAAPAPDVDEVKADDQAQVELARKELEAAARHEIARFEAARARLNLAS